MESKVYTALGLMSGTSLDGVDAAIIQTDGERVLGFGPSDTFAYSTRQRQKLAEATQAAIEWNFNGPPPNSLARATDIIENSHIEAILSILSMHGLSADQIDVIGFHGQTLLHDATRRRTFQIGSGDALAAGLRKPVVYDFRSADVAAGGQGAPLAPIYHKALVDWSDLEGVTAVLNLGGVGNVTIVSRETLLASDTGPANGPLDSWLGEVDQNGKISREGTIDFARVEQWLQRDFFNRDWPKSADRYDFDVLDEMQGMSRADGAATLCHFTAQSVAHTLGKMGQRPDHVIVCGGGRHNRTIMTMLAIELGCPVKPAEHAGWNSDAIEAQAFAYLAVRRLRDLPISFPTTTGVPHPMTGGRIAYPIKL